jgi:hypothetical protein
MQIGEIIRYKNRWNGCLFIIVDIRTNLPSGIVKAKCRRVRDNRPTRWSDIKTMEKVNESG